MNLLDKDLLSVQEARTLARDAKVAQNVLATFNSEQIDKIIRAMVKVALDNAVSLAEMAVNETGFGKVTDKTTKNQLASQTLYDYIKDMKTIGIINEDTTKKIIEIAEPMGVLMGIIPSTNPTSTVIFKSIISIKSRNGIVFSPHPSALGCTSQAAKLMHDAAVSAGAPKDIIGCISLPSMEGTDALMHAPEIALIIATGGSAMVKASYSAGKPALGVGPGNVPAYIERTADIKKAVNNILASKTFDNGTICASEQAVIVESCIKDQVVAEFKRQHAYFMNEEETKKVTDSLFNKGFAMNAQLMGRSANEIARKTGLAVPEGTSVLIGEQKGVGKEYPLSFEKLTTVLGFYTVDDWHEACDLCIKLLNNGGIGHSMAIHTEDRDMVLKFATKPVFRILVNTPSTHGGVGFSTSLAPSFTLGCGTWGGSATSDNVTPLHLVNIKRVAYGVVDVFFDPNQNTSAQCAHDSAKSFTEKAGDVNTENLAAIVTEVLRRLEKSGV